MHPRLRQRASFATDQDEREGREDNTSRADGRPIHGKYSRSRTVEAYVTAFAPWATIQPVGQYVDVGEVNTVFTGVVRPDGRAH